MLQFGRFAARVPKGHVENVQFRRTLYRLADESESYRQALLYACKVDPWFFLDAFAWQTNPRMVFDEDGPFLAWEAQREAVRRVILRWLDGRSSCIRKSRYQGGTWLSLFAQSWFCLFHDNKTFIDISHTAKAVDNSHDPNSLFWKIDFIHDHLPDWVRRGARHPAEAQIVYPATRGYVSGYATTKRAGVGGRATGVLSDEHGLQQDGRKIRANTATIGPRLFVSAHYDSKGDFLDVCNSPDYEQIDLHWTMNPLCNKGLYHFDQEKNAVVRHDDHPFPPDYPFVREFRPLGGFAPGVRSPWYDAMAKEIGNDRDVACQLDMDPTGASNLVFDAQVVARLKQKALTREPTFVGDLLYDAAARPAGLQANAKGPLRLWLNLKDGRPPQMRYVAGADVAWGSGGKDSTPSCISLASELGEKVAEFASNRIEPTPFAHYYVALARWFWDAEICWECPGPGMVLNKVIPGELNYWNFYWKKSRPGAVFGESDSDIPGWWNLPGSREKTNILKDLAAAMKDGEYANWSMPSLDECLQFVWVLGGKAEHNNEKNKHDPSETGANHGDRVMADAQCWMLLKPVRRKALPKPDPDTIPDNFYTTAAGLGVLFERQQREKERSRSRWVRL